MATKGLYYTLLEQMVRNTLIDNGLQHITNKASMVGIYVVYKSSVIIFGIRCYQKNKVAPMKRYMMGLAIFGFAPLLYAFIYYFPDVWTYLTFEGEVLEDIHLWQGYPYGLLWYAFILLALQVHSFSMYFAWNLITAWRSKGNKKYE